ncbi:hypothetical protein Tco_0981228 [Tanacetum coccineum]
MTEVTVLAPPATENAPAVPAQKVPVTYKNICPKNHAHFDAEAKAIHMILSGIRDDIYSTVDLCIIAKEMSKGKEVVKPLTSPFESAFDEDNDEEQAQRDKEISLMTLVQIDDDYNVFSNERQPSGQPESINDTYVVEKVDSNVIPDSLDMCDNKGKADQNAEEYKAELVKANASLAHELKECKYALEESNGIQDRCKSALHHQEIELEKYKTYKNCTIEKEEVEHKLKETLGLLAQQQIDLKEALKTQV